MRENVTNGKADNHEGIDFYRPVENPDKSKPLWGENQWPSVPGYKEKYESWIEKMKTLGMLVMEAYVQAFILVFDTSYDVNAYTPRLEWPLASEWKQRSGNT